MSDAEDQPDRIVFDAEPLIAYVSDEAGSDRVERYVDAVIGSSVGYISAVNLAEVHYVVRAMGGVDRADDAVAVIEDTGIHRVDTDETWRNASAFKAEYSIPLGDAFALATGVTVDGTVLVGADDDFDEVQNVDVERFRTESV